MTKPLATPSPLTCGAKTRSGRPCNNFPIRNKRRCKLHGGLSTGPRTAAAKKKQRIAAEKVESKERYGKLLSELETQMKSYEESDEPPSEKFFVDAVTLGADACNIPKSGLENEETLMNVLRYARLNIYTVFEGNTLEQGKTHADSLGSAIERLSR